VSILVFAGYKQPKPLIVCRKSDPETIEGRATDIKSGYNYYCWDKKKLS
jgi:hypothetical protein